jgi:5-methyltetrahydrofolate--homocysteine methyltransferase
MALFADRKAEAGAKKARPETVEERLKLRIVDGDKQGLEADLDEALKAYKPARRDQHAAAGRDEDGRRAVRRRQDAAAVRAPVGRDDEEGGGLPGAADGAGRGQPAGTIVLATVKGDVHDIGKNLVDIILTNNGYRVVNLGIKQPLATILEAAESHKADAVGMSGLLVKSTVIMRENLEEMARSGLKVPVLLGGAALTRAYVEEDCYKAYGEAPVAYARDAFDGLSLMDKVVTGGFAAHCAERAGKGVRAAASGRPACWRGRASPRPRSGRSRSRSSACAATSCTATCPCRRRRSGARR